MEQIQIKIINKSNNPDPEYATPGSSGLDLRAFLPAEEVLAPMQRKLIPTGIYLEIPEGYEVQVRPRSGLAIRHGITCVNSPGTVDSDYRGELKVVLINLSDEEFAIRNGERIAQMVVCEVVKARFQPVNTLTESVRGEGGFGHSGKI